MALNVVELLLTRFPVCRHSVYGVCVVVDAGSFREEWSEQLERVGSGRFVEGDRVFVVVPKGVKVPEHKWRELVNVEVADAGEGEVEVSVEEPVVEKPVEEIRRGRRGPGWSQVEELLLVKIAGDGKLSMEEVYAEFVRSRGKGWPVRSMSAVVNKLSALRMEGKVVKCRRKRSVEKGVVHEESVGAEEPNVPEGGKAESEAVEDDPSCSVIVFDRKYLLMRVRREDLVVWKELLRELPK